jgi:hypothetical protein
MSIEKLIQRLKKCCCNTIAYDCKEYDWYRIQLFYGKRYYRFFALSYEDLEKQSLSSMREANRKLKINPKKSSI